MNQNVGEVFWGRVNSYAKFEQLWPNTYSALKTRIQFKFVDLQASLNVLYKQTDLVIKFKNPIVFLDFLETFQRREEVISRIIDEARLQKNLRLERQHCERQAAAITSALRGKSDFEFKILWPRVSKYLAEESSLPLEQFLSSLKSPILRESNRPPYLKYATFKLGQFEISQDQLQAYVEAAKNHFDAISRKHAEQFRIECERIAAEEKLKREKELERIRLVNNVSSFINKLPVDFLFDFPKLAQSAGVSSDADLRAVIWVIWLNTRWSSRGTPLAQDLLKVLLKLENSDFNYRENYLRRMMENYVATINMRHDLDKYASRVRDFEQYKAEANRDRKTRRGTNYSDYLEARYISIYSLER